MNYRVLEICAGAGGQALGLEAAGFEHVAAVEIDPHACATLRANRPAWKVVEADVRDFDAQPYAGTVDLLAGGVPCPPFSVAGKQLGANDDRDLFPQALRLVQQLRPRAVMLENVPGFASDKFKFYRSGLFTKLRRLGYRPALKILNARDFGIAQLRPRCLVVALRDEDAPYFVWPGVETARATVGELLYDLMSSGGWSGAAAWRDRAAGIAPTIVGGSKKHGGPDLGPTRARQQWALLGVNGIGIADAPPDENFPATGIPKLTVRMVARLQGFPDTWQFCGGKTAAYRQVGNAFPSAVASAVARSIKRAFDRVWDSTEGQGHLIATERLTGS